MQKTGRQKLRVLFATFEADPFGKTGGLGEVAGSLPQAVRKLGFDMRVILPKLPTIPPQLAARLTHVADFTVPLGWRRQYCGIERLDYKYQTYYFIDNEYYFKRDRFYGYDDDDERIAFFAKAVLEALQHIPDFFPQIIHCNDWHTALTPLLLREQFQSAPGYADIKTVFSVHNLKFQGQFGPWVLGDVLGLADNPAAAGQLMVNGGVNYVHGALCYADRLLTVSPTYAEEICSPDYGEGLDGVFRRRQNVLGGILNGIDYKTYNPARDKFLPATFTADDLSGKAECKRALQQELSLPQQADKPLAVIVSRLTEQKGLDLLLHILDELLDLPVQLAVLGVGDAKYEQAFIHTAETRENFACRLLFDDGAAHRMYAGADMLLMPSRFEPCGLAQMIAMRYGTLPIVRETGGLKDSVQPYNQYTGAGNGFSFAAYNAHELLFTVKRALDAYAEPNIWQQLVQNAMAEDFSWQRSAEAYAQIYRDLLAE